MNFFKKIYSVTKNLILSVGVKKPKVMNSFDTIDYILKNNVSIGRYGDGEMDLIRGNGINFQKYNPALSKKLAEVKTTDNFLTCIPNIFEKKYFNRKDLKKPEYTFWIKNKLMHGFMWKKTFNKMICGDAFISRFYIRYTDKSKVEEYIHLFEKLWNKRNLIIVEGENSKIGCENNLLKNANSIRRIICPSLDAFDYYEEIISQVKTNYNDGDLVLIALGPTATVLAYDLSKEGIQALDLGHFDIEYEWFLAKTEERIPVKNKHVNECATMGNNESNDLEYKNQIIVNLMEQKRLK
ncbi:MAG: GT-D fold domain-containing glycosyltransferase [Clostridia bacterium]